MLDPDIKPKSAVTPTIAMTGLWLVRNRVAIAPASTKSAESTSGRRTAFRCERARAAQADSKPIGIRTSPAW